MKMHRKVVAVVAAAATVLGVSACGAGIGSTGGSGDGLTPEAEEAVDAAFEGSFGSPPTDSPDPEPGKNIWLITISAQYTDFEAPGQMADAADKMGWDLTIFDGQFNPDTVVSGLRQAVADQADGVIVFSVDCSIAKAGFDDVHSAGIPVVAFESIDCDQAVNEDGAVTDTGEPGLFDAIVAYNDPEDPDKPLTFPEFWGGVAAPYQALGIIGATDGAAKIIKLRQTDTQSTLASDRGFDETLDEYCPDCEVVETVELVGSDIGPALQDKVAQALARHPEANAVYALYDAVALSVAPAVLATGRADDIYVMAGEGTKPVVDLVTEGRGANAGIVYSVQWEAWAALDAMNRLLAGERPTGAGFPSGMGVQLYDADRNVPYGEHDYYGSVDVASEYLKAWGIQAG